MLVNNRRRNGFPGRKFVPAALYLFPIVPSCFHGAVNTETLSSADVSFGRKPLTPRLVETLWSVLMTARRNASLCYLKMHCALPGDPVGPRGTERRMVCWSRGKRKIPMALGERFECTLTRSKLLPRRSHSQKWKAPRMARVSRDFDEGIRELLNTLF